MAANLNNESDKTQPSQNTGECPALLAAAVPDLYRKNAFRITGLAIDATTREIAKHIDKLRTYEELGQLAEGLPKAFPIKPTPTFDDIREAEKKLRDPEQRFIDEFFWFWPIDWRNGKEDVSLRALATGNTAIAESAWSTLETLGGADGVASHNLAVRWHMAALGFENQLGDRAIDTKGRETLEKTWVYALKRWSKICQNDSLWEVASNRVKQIADPRLTTGFVRRLRNALPRAIASINANLALNHVEAGDRGYQVAMHARLILDLDFYFVEPSGFVDLVLGPARSRITAHISRAAEAVAESPERANVAARDLYEKVRRYAELFDLISETDDDRPNDLLDEAASACNRLIVSYQSKTGDNKIFVEVLTLVLNIARGETVRKRINENIAIGRDNLLVDKVQPVHTILEGINQSKELPSARLKRFQNEIEPPVQAARADLDGATNVRVKLFNALAAGLRSIAIDAWNDKRDSATAATAGLLAIHYACDADLIALLKADTATLDRLIGEQRSLQKKKRLKMICGAVGAFVLVAWIYFGSESPPTATNNNPNSASAPIAPPRPADMPLDVPAKYEPNRTYHIPHAYAAELESESQRIDAEKAKAKVIADELAAANTRVEAEQAEAAMLRATVNTMQESVAAEEAYLDNSNETAVAAFNRDVDAYNALIRRTRSKTASANKQVAAYNDIVARQREQDSIINPLVDAYNAKLVRVGH
jgi:hypothetical protein